MNLENLVLLSPFIAVALASIAVMLAATLWKTRFPALLITVVGLAAGLASTGALVGRAPALVTPLLLINGYSLYFSGLVLACSLGVALLSMGYFAHREQGPVQFCLFLLLSTLGAMVIASSSHFASLLLGLELQGAGLYPLAAYARFTPASIEAGIKYLVPSTVASAFLVFGMALVYADSGVMDFGSIAAIGRAPAMSLLMTVGLLMILSGAAFKLALVPFHLWTPDVYQGAPAPATAFVATVSKTAVVGLLMRFFAPFTDHGNNAVTASLWVLAIASMFAGNLLALRQENVKRIIAYSSIAHMGYVLVAFLCGTALGIVSATYYVTAYAITVLCALAVVSLLSHAKETESLADFRGLALRRPLVAFLFTVAMMSLAGIPFTVGFIGKFYVLSAGVQSRVWPLTFSLAVSSAIGLYYYLRVVIVMYRHPAPASEKDAGTAVMAGMSRPLSAAGMIVLGTAGVLLVCFGVYPGPLFDFIAWMVGS
jgi:NADH-quinone oxidoreductase subunit N